MKRKILSLICGLALMLTMFCVPVGAAEQLVGYDYRTIETTTGDYYFTLGVVTASAATTGEATGIHSMHCSMFIETPSGTYSNSGSRKDTLEVTISGHGNISYAESACSVPTLSKYTVLSVY